ncbi:MAG: AAA family ATPase [Candidatus Brocadiaceae bacterium]|jgi:MoxR-like ATPase
MAETETGGLPESDRESVAHLCDGYERLRAEISKVIVGQEEVVEQMLICLLAGGHAILEGVPGLAKTLMIRTLARCLSLSFSRIQFTPDLMPGDITGTEVLEEDRATGSRQSRFIKGPVFANVVLADEINRTPPKTQAALLEAMQEKQVTFGGMRYGLPAPFFVLATQNPIEQEGTYPLPEAQQDRFMFKILVSYPSWEEEFQIMRLTAVEPWESVQPVMGAEEILELQDIVRRVPVADRIVHYGMTLARRTRVGTAEDVPPFIREWVRWGIGPRACQFMLLAARARALLHRRYHVSVEDVQAVAKPVMRHRLVTTFTAASEDVEPDRIVEELIAHTPAREGPLSRDARIQEVLRPGDPE